MKLSGVFSCANSPAFSRDAEQFICTARYTFAVLGPEWVALRKQNRESIIAPPNVVRHRLLEALQREPVPRIVVIMAPAGYGKTTLALQWAEFTATKSAFLSLTNEHNTPDRFLQGLMRAIGLEPPGSPSLDTALDAIDQFAKGLSRSVLIIDDYHVIENQEIHQLMSILISRLPAGLQLVMSSRTAPEIPLARLRMNGQVRDITLSELSFSEDEIAELVTSSSVPFVSQDDIRELATRTAGWIAGIRLAMASTNANAMRPSRTASIIDSWSTQQALDEFVLEEVLSSLSDVLREFIFRTAFLPNLNADLCNHVLEIDNSAALLDEAIREVAFIRPASGGSSELAYHRLFAECANRIAERHYPLADRTARYLRAAAWFESQGKWEEAFEQALQAEEWEAVVRYTRRICGDLRQRDMSASRLHWLRKVPLQHILSHGDLTRWLVSALLETGHVTEANGILKQVMPAWAESGDPQLLAYMHMTSTFTSILQGNDGEALRSIYTALHYQTMDNHLERLHIWASIMLLEFHRGNDEIADEAYVQLQLCRQHLPAEQGWIFTHVEMAKTDQFARRGHLSTAIDRYQDQVDRQPAIFSHAIPNLQSRMAALYLEQNNLDMALEMARNIERGLELYPQQLWHTEAWLVVARVYAALGDRDRAREAINQARAIQETGGGWTLWLKIMATESWVNLSDPGSPKTSTTNIAVDNDKPFRTAFFGELDPRFVKVVQQITEGDLAQAAPLLESLLTGAIKTKRWAEIVQLAVWQVVIRLKSGDDAGALDALNLALRYGRPGGFVRSFVTPGYDLSAFMRDSLSLLDPENARYVQHLLQHDLWATSQPPIEEAVMSKGMSPLSSREHDVLTFLATGVSNKSISEKLFITERTVKKHVSNILQKLKVPNRTAAVARARELGIIT